MSSGLSSHTSIVRSADVRLLTELWPMLDPPPAYGRKSRSLRFDGDFSPCLLALSIPLLSVCELSKDLSSDITDRLLDPPGNEIYNRHIKN